MQPCLILGLSLLTACAAIQADGPTRKPFKLESVIKSDIDTVVEINLEIVQDHLRRLMVKLYKRNPRELAKSRHNTIPENIDRLFARTDDWTFPELDGKTGIAALYLTFDDAYQGDRVFALMAGMTSMLMASYDYKTEFYLFDNLDAQKLYNSARNIEIAMWKLSNTLDARGYPYLLTNSRIYEVPNLSYERLFGKLIATQDNLAVVIADKNNRVIKKVLQNMATAVFLPI